MVSDTRYPTLIETASSSTSISRPASPASANTTRWTIGGALRSRTRLQLFAILVTARYAPASKKVASARSIVTMPTLPRHAVASRLAVPRSSSPERYRTPSRRSTRSGADAVNPV